MCVCLCVGGNSAFHFAGSSPLGSAVASRLLLCPWATWARHHITPQPLGYFDCFVAVLRSDVPAERCEERWGRQLRLGVSITCFSFFLLFSSVLFASFSFLLDFFFHFALCFSLSSSSSCFHSSAAVFGLFSRFTLKEKLPASLSPAPQQMQSPTVPPPSQGGEESILSSRRTECITLCSQPQCVSEDCLCSQSRWLLQIWCLY